MAQNERSTKYQYVLNRCGVLKENTKKTIRASVFADFPCQSQYREK